MFSKYFNFFNKKYELEIKRLEDNILELVDRKNNTRGQTRQNQWVEPDELYQIEILETQRRFKLEELTSKRNYFLDKLSIFTFAISILSILISVIKK